MNVSRLCSRIITYSYYLLFFLVPLFLTPLNYELFEYNKMMMTYGLTTIIVTAWVAKMIAERKVTLIKTPLDIPIFVFLATLFLSSLLSIDPHISWFGYYSRFNGGMFSIISYVLLYYAFVNNIKFQKANSKYTNQKLENNNETMKQYDNVTPLLHTVLISAFLVSLYGIAEKFGIDAHIWVQDVRTRVFSTLGQPNWLAAYLVALMPLTWAKIIRSQKSEVRSQNKKAQSYNLQPTTHNLKLTIFYYILSSILFLTLLFTGSRAGLVGFFVTALVFWLGTILLNKKTISCIKKPFLIIHAIFFVMIIFQGTRINAIDQFVTLKAWQRRFQPKHEVIDTSKKPRAATGTVLETGGTESSEIRKYVWQGAINAWRESTKTILIGTGTETFAFAFYKHKPVEHNLTSEWDFLYNKAHNEFINYLTTTGIIGLSAYLFLIGSFIFWFIQKFRTMKQLNNEAILLSLFAGYISILVTNFFGFSVVIVQIMLYVFPALVFILYYQQYPKKLKQQSYSVKFPKKAYNILTILTLIIGATTLLTIMSLWEADRRFASGYRLAKLQSYQNAATLMRSAIQINPNEPFYHDEYARTLSELAILAAQAQDATKTAELISQTLAHSDTALKISPAHVNYWKTRTRAYYSFSTFDPAFLQASIEAISTAHKLAPADAKVMYNLAVLTGYTGNNEDAIKYLQQTIALKKNYKDAYYALYVFYKELDDPTRARTILEQYLRDVNPNDKEFINLLEEL